MSDTSGDTPKFLYHPQADSDLAPQPLEPGAALPKNALITLGEAGHFFVPDDLQSAMEANSLARDASAVLRIPAERTFATAKDHDIESIPKRLVENYILPRVSEKSASGKLKKVDMETALDGARLSLLTHSFGERMARTAGNEMFDALTSKHTFDVPYTPEEAEAICKQVLVIGLGGALEYDVDRMADGKIAYAKPVSHLNHVSLYGESEESVRMAAEAKPDSLLIACSNHSQDAYMHALETQPQVVDALNHLINEKRLPERAVETMAPVLPSIDLLNQNPDFHPKLASFSHMKGISI